jgi:hypothetical protein
VDHFTISYGGKKMKEDGMDFAFHVPHSPKFTISFNPEKGTVKKVRKWTQTHWIRSGLMFS